MSYNYIDNVGVAELVAKIKAKYATKTSIPTKVSDLTNDSSFQSESQVAASIAAAIAGVTQYDYSIVEELPASGVKGTIYLVPDPNAEGQNIYDEFIWIDAVGTTAGYFEQFGPKLDLSPYLQVAKLLGDTNFVDVSTDSSGNTNITLTAAVKASLGLADTAVQPSDLVAIPNADIDALFEDTSSEASQG